MITSHTFTERRHILAHQLAKPIALAANTQMQSKADTPFKFTQDASFFYYTGIEDADWKLLFDGSEWHLGAPDVSEVHRIFDGALGDDEAKALSGINSVLTLQQFEAVLIELAEKHPSIAAIGVDPSADRYDFVLNPARELLEDQLKRTFNEVEDCRLAVNKQRAIKSADEIAEIQAAIDVTLNTFEKLRDNLPNFTKEYELEALLSFEYRNHGFEGHAYDPIVAGGKNACTLHYVKNNDALPKPGLVLIDSGAKSHGYAADITRTYAVGMPSERERAVHNEVEIAHHKIIDLLKPDLSIKDYHDAVDEIMKTALQNLGLLNEPDDYRTYFPHSVSHGLGIDVHDPLGRPKKFRPGMVLTVEPGIYIPEEGIGVRIEDNILITETGNLNLSVALSTGL